MLWGCARQEGVAAVLGLCFRLLADPKNSDSVVSTAAATVRQACTPHLACQLPLKTGLVYGCFIFA